MPVPPDRQSAVRELILGGQKSGKSRCAEARAVEWLGIPGREATLLATARAGDAEMSERIHRHREDRKVRVPRLATVEASASLAAELAAWSAPRRLVIVDCLTLWLTQLMLPIDGAAAAAAEVQSAIDELIAAAVAAPGPLVFVSNEIGLGVIPLLPEVRHFIDALGLLHQALGAICGRVTLMVAGCECQVRVPV